MKKIFFIDPQSYSNLAVYDYSLLEYNKDFDIKFFGNSLYSYKILETVKFIQLFSYSKYTNRLIKTLSYFFSIVRLLQNIIIDRPQIIHIQWIRLWYIDYWFLKLLRQISKVKIIYTAHNVLPHESGQSQFAKYKKYYNLIDKIITHSFASKIELTEKFDLPDHKVEVIPHGVLDYNLDSMLVLNHKKSFKEKFSIDGKIVFAVLGNQSMYKGSDIISKVWEETKKLHDVSKYRLLIIGKNKNIDFSALEIIENVFIENRFVSDEEFASILKLTDVLLLPYRTISQSGVLLSAINDSVPVIVSNVGGLPESLSIGDIGWNIGEASFKSLQSILLDIINEPQIIYKMKSNKNEWGKVKKYYSWEGISKQTFDLYKSVLKE